MVRARKTTPDGRQSNGGARQGTPGQQYANRSDLRAQKPTAVPGQEYGKAGAQLAAQKVVPMAAAPAPPVPAAPPSGSPPAAAGAAGPPPPPPPDLYRPTERPNEAVTHGLPMGPGAGPEVLPIQAGRMTDPLAIQIRALFQQSRNNPAVAADLADLLADLR